ncbi:MAG: putative threonylcarbamoyl-AMP synthase [Candidatus Phytoplasma pruni]
MTKKNKIIIFPTDTVYGIGAKINDTENLKKIYQIKKRDLNKPIAILFYSLEQVKNIALIDLKIIKISLFFWPGALTLIVNTTPSFYQLTKEKKIGIRIPNHKLALKILKDEGPLRATSVNDSGQPPLNNFKEIVDKYQNQVDYIYPNEQTNSNVSSTVIDTTAPSWEIIRKGDISLEMIKQTLI